MPSAFALGIFSGKIIFISQFWKICGFSRIAFSRVGFWNELPQSKPDGFDCSLSEGAFGMVGKLLIAPEALATSLRSWLSLRGKTSPAPGEDVAQRQKGESGAGAPERVIYNSCCSNPLTVSTVRVVKPAALMAAAASSKPKVSAAVSWASAVMITLPPSLFHSPSSHAPG